MVYAAVPQKEIPVIKVNRRGNPEDLGEEVTPTAFGWVKHAPPGLGGSDRPEGERRLALAEWITHPDNPSRAVRLSTGSGTTTSAKAS